MNLSATNVRVPAGQRMRIKMDSATMASVLAITTSNQPGIPRSVECGIDKNSGLFVYGTRKPLKKVVDGTSKTVAIGETKYPDNTSNWNPWAFGAVYESLRSTWNPLNLEPEQQDAVNQPWGKENGAFGSEHPGGANFVYIDSHVEYISDDIDLTIYRALGSIYGND